jgi:hypothetical protein
MAADLGGPMGEANYGLALQEGIGGRLSTSLGGPPKLAIKARPRSYRPITIPCSAVSVPRDCFDGIREYR